MKTMMRTAALAAVAALLSFTATAQEHWTEGPVWECSAYRTAPGMFDTYLKWIRTHSEPINAEAKKQGLIIDFKTFVKWPADPHDWDVMFCTLYPSFAKAMDYDPSDEAKYDAIAEKHWATADEDKQSELAQPPLEVRKYLSTMHVREVNLRPRP